MANARGHLKVGIAFNPWKRLDELQKSDRSIKLVEIFLTRNIYANLIESLAHERLAEFCVKREWFDAPLQIVQKTIREIIRDDLEQWSRVRAKRWDHDRSENGWPPFRRAEFPPP